MGRIAIVLVALMLLLAGCSTGSDSGTDGTETTTTPEMTEPGETTADDDSETTSETQTDDSDDDSDTTDEDVPVNLSETFNSTGEDTFSGKVELDMTLYNGSNELSLLYRNDTQEELVRIDDSRQSGETTYYVSERGSAVRNTTSGETRYGAADGPIATEAGFSLFITFAGFAYVGVMDWEYARTTTVDGEEAYVFEADSLNRSTEGDLELNIDPSEVQSATGELTVTQEGIQSSTVRIETPEGTFGVDFDLQRGGDIDVQQPEWVDESQFGS